MLGFVLGNAEGLSLCATDGLPDETSDGTLVGTKDDLIDGPALGELDTTMLGFPLGIADGLSLGAPDGLSDRISDGTLVGTEESDGAELVVGPTLVLGESEGALLGIVLVVGVAVGIAEGLGVILKPKKMRIARIT